MGDGDRKVGKLVALVVEIRFPDYLIPAVVGRLATSWESLTTHRK